MARLLPPVSSNRVSPGFRKSGLRLSDAHHERRMLGKVRPRSLLNPNRDRSAALDAPGIGREPEVCARTRGLEARVNQIQAGIVERPVRAELDQAAHGADAPAGFDAAEALAIGRAHV